MERRKFLKTSGLALASAGFMCRNTFTGQNKPDNSSFPFIKKYHQLGRTGFNVSDIGCGTILIQDENLLRAIIDHGVNYIDTAKQYNNGNNERMVGRAIKKYERESLFINTKIIITKEMTEDDIVNEISECHKRIDSGYIDCLQMHMAGSVEEIRNPAFRKAIRKLKKQGIIRYCGVSCHGQSWYTESIPMDQVLDAAIDEGFFDIFLLVYNFVQRDMAENIFQRCNKQDIGITIMKTNPFGGLYSTLKETMEGYINEGKELPDWLKKINDRTILKQEKAIPFLKKYGLQNESDIRDASVKFVLDNPSIHSVILTFQNSSDIDGYIKLSGQHFEYKDQQGLSVCNEIFGRFYCKHACGICEPACPYKVPINTIMRYNHYFLTRGRLKNSITEYQKLQTNKADLCSRCSAPCQVACPYGVQIHSLMKFAHTNLSSDHIHI
jgi:uncharacterized protein